MTDETRARANALQQSRPSIPDLLDGYCVHGRTIAYDNGGEDKIAASDCQECIALFVAELAREQDGRKVAVEALRDLLGNMGIEQDDPRISYVTVQLPRESIADARAALDAQPEEPSECKSKWIPKSMIRDEDENEIQIPEWFAEKEGLI